MCCSWPCRVLAIGRALGVVLFLCVGVGVGVGLILVVLLLVL